MEGGLPLNALLERCLDFIIDFHLLFLLWVPLLLSFSAEHSWSLKVSWRAFIFCYSACWFTFTYVSARVLVGLLFLLPFFASFTFSATNVVKFLLMDSLLHRLCIVWELLLSNCQLMLLQKIDDVATLSQTRTLLDHGRLQQIAWVLHYAISWSLKLLQIKWQMDVYLLKCHN